MKRIFSIFPLFCALALVLGTHGCTADISMSEIDTSIELDANIAAPIGSIHFTLGDFVGTGEWGIYVDSNGVLTFKDTFSIERPFHKLDLKQYISTAKLDMKVYDQLGGVDYVVGTGSQIVLNFPMVLNLQGINNDEEYQRLDSALIEHASFVSNITRLGGLPLEWEWIDRVTIDLNKDFFNRPAGNIVTVYERGARGGYGEDMQIVVDNFSLNLMKNRNPQGFRDYWENVVDSCDLSVSMYLTIPESAGVIALPRTSAFHYELGVQFIDYSAVWGMFEASSDMSNEDEIMISDMWSVWSDLRSAKLPFADPSIDMQITTQIAGALELTGEYLYVKDENDVPVYATFDGKETFYKVFNKYEYLSLDSEIGTSKTVHQLFDKDPLRGHIDRLFGVHPEKLGYKFFIDFNQVETPQIRITNNTTIKVDAICDLPFIFNEGVTIDYADTIREVDLSAFSLDTLLGNMAMVDTLEKASAVLALTFTNDIPFQIKGVFSCLNENGAPVIDPRTEKPFLLGGLDTLLIPSPKYTYNELALSWVPEVVEYVELIDIDKEDLELLSDVKQIVFSASLDDKSLSDVFKSNNFTTKLTEQEGLRIKIAVGANVEAILKLDNGNQE